MPKILKGEGEGRKIAKRYFCLWFTALIFAAVHENLRSNYGFSFFFDDYLPAFIFLGGIPAMVSFLYWIDPTFPTP